MGEPLLSDEAMQVLHDATELDYLTHIVFRMYENKRCGPAQYGTDRLSACLPCDQMSGKLQLLAKCSCS